MSAHGQATEVGTTRVKIVAFDPLDPADEEIFLASCVVNDASGRAAMGELHTPYSPDELRARQRTVTDRRIEFYAALVDEAVVGEAIIHLPLVDNQHLAVGWLSVAPEFRGRGIGSALVQQLETFALGAGRRTLCLESINAIGQQSAVPRFAERHGFTPAQANHRNDLVVPTDRKGLDLMLAGIEREVTSHEQECSARYELLTWWDSVPAEWLDDRAALFARMITDAPTGEVDVTEEVWDAHRVAEQDEIARAQGRRTVTTVAFDPTSGHLVGVTSMLIVPPAYVYAYQADTLVLREHRGHRLGQHLKATNLRALAATMPGVERVLTFNAQDNGPMLRINRAMGFVPVAETTEWQKHLS